MPGKRTVNFDILIDRKVINISQVKKELLENDEK